MKKTKTQKGITLVALIITIVVLLILALVTINAVRGDGIIGKAQQAKENYERGADEESKTLEGYLAWLEGSISEDSSLGESEENNSDSSQNENQDNNEEYVVKEISNVNSTINGKPYSSINPIIPAGFKAINTKTSKWNSTNGPEVNKGLVISDGNSEFVWVPITTAIEKYELGTDNYREPDVATGVSPSSTVNSASGTEYDAVKENLDIAGCTYDFNNDGEINAYDFKIQLTNEFEAMSISVNKYGGFYVGRYETSIKNGKAQSVKGETSATAETTSGNTWYGLYAIQKAYKTNSVQSSMIWGSQYDAMMTWMGSQTTTTMGHGINETRLTGTVETDKIKNVYDLYGNTNEWTLESGGRAYRVYRGGASNYNITAKLRWNGEPTSTSNGRGSRLTLYIL